MKKLLALLIACLALTATACGGDDDEGGSSSTTTTEQAKTSPGDNAQDEGGSAAAPVDVKIIDNDYDPSGTTVPAGTTVTWTNVGDAPHTVTKEEGPGEDFDSGTLEPAQTFEQTLEEPGDYSYVCTIHPGQEGSITVE